MDISAFILNMDQTMKKCDSSGMLAISIKRSFHWQPIYQACLWIVGLALVGLVVKLWLISFVGGQQSFTDEIIIKLCGTKNAIAFCPARVDRFNHAHKNLGMSQNYTFLKGSKNNCVSIIFLWRICFLRRSNRLQSIHIQFCENSSEESKNCLRFVVRATNTKSVTNCIWYIFNSWNHS